MKNMVLRKRLTFEELCKLNDEKKRDYIKNVLIPDVISGKIDVYSYIENAVEKFDPSSLKETAHTLRILAEESKNFPEIKFPVIKLLLYVKKNIDRIDEVSESLNKEDVEASLEDLYLGSLAAVTSPSFHKFVDRWGWLIKGVEKTGIYQIVLNINMYDFVFNTIAGLYFWMLETSKNKQMITQKTDEAIKKLISADDYIPITLGAGLAYLNIDFAITNYISDVLHHQNKEEINVVKEKILCYKNLMVKGLENYAKHNGPFNDYTGRVCCYLTLFQKYDKIPENYKEKFSKWLIKRLEDDIDGMTKQLTENGKLPDDPRETIFLWDEKMRCWPARYDYLNISRRRLFLIAIIGSQYDIRINEGLKKITNKITNSDEIVKVGGYKGVKINQLLLWHLVDSRFTILNLKNFLDQDARLKIFKAYKNFFENNPEVNKLLTPEDKKALFDFINK